MLGFVSYWKSIEMISMFDPNDWIRKIRDINGQVRITYKNVDTELEKVRETFSHEQQEALKAHEVKIYARGELE